jgi:LysR family transcriptional regulator, glycine cleavage system transcriptional activator
LHASPNATNDFTCALDAENLFHEHDAIGFPTGRPSMSYRLPPLNGLRAFEAAARHLSFKHAANELGVTPGAVSQQVRALERALGIALFRRLPRSLLLTAEGEAFQPSITAAFRMIADAVEAAAPALAGRRLRLAVAPSLLTCPAVLQLRHRKAADPTSGDDLALLIEGRADALLRPAGGTYPGFHAERIELRRNRGTTAPADIITVPGFAGCKEHRALLKMLKG